jgi:hypothetical protein
MDVPVGKESRSGMTFQEDISLLDGVPNKMKREEIVLACEQRNLKQLVQLASSAGGLLDDELRQSACMTATLLISNWPSC